MTMLNIRKQMVKDIKEEQKSQWNWDLATTKMSNDICDKMEKTYEMIKFLKERRIAIEDED